MGPCSVLLFSSLSVGVIIRLHRGERGKRDWRMNIAHSKILVEARAVCFFLEKGKDTLKMVRCFQRKVQRNGEE